MAAIQILGREISELIAAGEVVERPSSVVKELVENAIDAGAAVITVELKNGGVRSIRVTDDGAGIPREDVPKAFFRHATSKVASAEDLYKIGTLGFRGEALASIAAVSRVEILTKTKEDPHGTRYEIAGGVPGVLEDAGCPGGTTIIARDLFYNIPARMKFLKKDSTEGSAVAGLLDRLALSHPEISFRLIRDGERKLCTPGDGKLLSAVHAVYGGDFGGSLIPVAHRQGSMAVEGYITRPESAKASRAMQHFFINGRYVKSMTMMAGLEDACKGSVMTGKFPGCVLSLTIPWEMVDVNVHPAKLEVKFSEEGAVYAAVLAGCGGALSGLGQTTQARDASKGYQARLNLMEITSRPDRGEQQRMTAPEYRRMGEAPSVEALRRQAAPAGGQALMRDGGTLADALYRQPPPVMAPPVYRPGAGGQPRKLPLSGPAVSNPGEAINPPKKEDEIFSVGERPQVLQADISEEEQMVLIGELFSTYILAQTSKEFLLVDKHAAHERILYNRLLADHEAGQIPRQTLLASLRVTLPKEGYGALLEHPGEVSRAGFEIDDFADGSVLVREIPAALELADAEAVLGEMAEALLAGKGKVSPRFYEELCHSIACKGAVKGNRFTTPDEQRELLKMLSADPSVRQCPHGRPVIIAMTRQELDRMFGRIQ